MFFFLYLFKNILYCFNHDYITVKWTNLKYNRGFLIIKTTISLIRFIIVKFQSELDESSLTLNSIQMRFLRIFFLVYSDK